MSTNVGGYMSNLERFSNEDLDLIQGLLLTGSKEELIIKIEKIKKTRSERKTKSLNDMFLVDQLNIDQEYIDRLKSHGIFNQTQLLEADLDEISLEGSEARKQYEYAREMFDFRPQEEKERQLGRKLTNKELVKSIIKKK